MAQGKIATFMARLDERIPRILGRMDRAQAEEYLPPMVQWSGAEIEGENMIRVTREGLPSYGLFWRDRPIGDNYQQRRFAHGLLDISLHIEKVPESRSVMDFWYNMRDILIEDFTEVLRGRQALGIVHMELSSSATSDQQVNEDFHLLVYRMQFDIVIS
jgi:hypothetical protein